MPGERIRMALTAVCTDGACSGSAALDVDAATGAISPQTFEQFIGRSLYTVGLFNRVDYKGGSCTAEECGFRFCIRLEYEASDCDSGPCVTKSINETRACGTFGFERPRLIPEVTDSWDNQCAPFEARLP
jgi:hypothetical protein